MKHPVAILLFSRSAVEEAGHKSFSACGKPTDKRIAQQLISTTEKIATQTGLPLIRISSGQQQGSTFGEKLSHAFRLAFNKGFTKVLAIGNDCPYLNASLLKNAALQLLQEDVVIGPAKDGGAYLIGLSISSFEEESFRQLPWQTAELYQSLQQYCGNYYFSYKELPLYSDLDTAWDVVCFLRNNRQPASVQQLLLFLRNILHKRVATVVTYTLLLLRPCAATALSRRGPPIVF